jgi:hypothetical protein
MWVQRAEHPHRVVNLGNYTEIEPPVLLANGNYNLRCFISPMSPAYDDIEITARGAQRMVDNKDTADLGVAIEDWEWERPTTFYSRGG